MSSSTCWAESLNPMGMPPVASRMPRTEPHRNEADAVGRLEGGAVDQGAGQDQLEHLPAPHACQLEGLHELDGAELHLEIDEAVALELVTVAQLAEEGRAHVVERRTGRRDAAADTVGARERERRDVDLGDEGRLPPSLSFVGARLERQWLRAVLEDGGVARPYMATRMPQFGQANVEQLGPLLRAAAGVPAASPGPDDGPTTDDQAAEIGRQLVGAGGFNCIQCHSIAGRPSTGLPGPDLVQMVQRLRYDYFADWLTNPKMIRPGTRMPPSGASSQIECQLLVCPVNPLRTLLQKQQQLKFFSNRGDLVTPLQSGTNQVSQVLCVSRGNPVGRLIHVDRLVDLAGSLQREPQVVVRLGSLRHELSRSLESPGCGVEVAFAKAEQPEIVVGRAEVLVCN